jgi:hypothetical protein
MRATRTSRGVEKAARDLERARTGNADHADAAAAGRRGNRDDGVVDGEHVASGAAAKSCG